jgi:hypothetical protein
MKNISIHTVKDGRKEAHLGDESSDFRTEELQDCKSFKKDF